jgi:hypothetical protein
VFIKPRHPCVETLCYGASLVAPPASKIKSVLAVKESSHVRELKPKDFEWLA